MALHRVRGAEPPDVLSFAMVRTGGVWRISLVNFAVWVPWAPIVEKAPPDKEHRRNLRRWCELFADFAAGARAEAEKPSASAFADRKRDKRARELVDGALHGIERLKEVPWEFSLSGSRLLFEYKGYWDKERKKGDWTHAPYFEERNNSQTPAAKPHRRIVSFDRFDPQVPRAGGK